MNWWFPGGNIRSIASACQHVRTSLMRPILQEQWRFSLCTAIAISIYSADMLQDCSWEHGHILLETNLELCCCKLKTAFNKSVSSAELLLPFFSFLLVLFVASEPILPDHSSVYTFSRYGNVLLFQLLPAEWNAKLFLLGKGTQIFSERYFSTRQVRSFLTSHKWFDP